MGWVGRNDMCARRDAAALRWCRDDCTTLACTLACRAAGKSSNEEEGGLSNGKTRSSVTAAPRHLLETETRGRPSPLASCEAPRHPALRVDGGGGLRMAHQPQHAERCRRPPSGCVTDPRGETKPATLRPRRIASLMRLSRGKRFLLRARAIFENPPPSPSNRQPPSLANVARTHGLSMPCASSVLEITCVNEMTSSPPTACRAGVGDRPSVRSRVSGVGTCAVRGTCGAGTHASERSTWATSRERQTECAATQAYAGMQWGGD